MKGNKYRRLEKEKEKEIRTEEILAREKERFVPVCPATVPLATVPRSGSELQQHPALQFSSDSP